METGWLWPLEKLPKMASFPIVPQIGLVGSHTTLGGEA